MRTIGCSTLALLLLSGCANVGGPYPSLQPRAGELVDPRLPVGRPMNDRPVSAALAGQLTSLVAQARAGHAAFEASMSTAERLTAAGGAPQSEAWIAAQEALTAAIAAGGPTRIALADIDAIAATALRTQGGIAPNDLAAIQSASREVASLDQDQADRVAAAQRRLGI
jgi:hypothetical protein